jgi:hypothetical protein
MVSLDWIFLQWRGWILNVRNVDSPALFIRGIEQIKSNIQEETLFIDGLKGVGIALSD